MRPARPLAGLANRTHLAIAGWQSWVEHPACRATARRTVRSSGSTRSRPTTSACHPNLSAATTEARRTFTSRAAAFRRRDANSVLTSITSSVRDAACQASTSIEPRSPNREKDTSNSTCPPSSLRIFPISPTRAACPSSRSLSTAAPFHSAKNRSEASMAAKQRSISSTVSWDSRNCSRAEILLREPPHVC